jgi:hypothetical protein
MQDPLAIRVSAVTSTALSKIAALTLALVAQEPKLTWEQAYARILRQNPKLYEQYLDARDAAIAVRPAGS